MWWDQTAGGCSPPTLPQTFCSLFSFRMCLMFALSLTALAHSFLSNSISLFIRGNRNVPGMSSYPSSLSTQFLIICPVLCSIPFFFLGATKKKELLHHRRKRAVGPPLTWDQTHPLGGYFPGEQHPIFSCLLLGPHQAEKRTVDRLQMAQPRSEASTLCHDAFIPRAQPELSPVQTSWGNFNLPACFCYICLLRESLRNIYSSFGICCVFHKLFLTSPIKTYPEQNSFQFPI